MCDAFLHSYHNWCLPAKSRQNNLLGSSHILSSWSVQLPSLLNDSTSVPQSQLVFDIPFVEWIPNSHSLFHLLIPGELYNSFLQSSMQVKVYRKENSHCYIAGWKCFRHSPVRRFQKLYWYRPREVLHVANKLIKLIFNDITVFLHNKALQSDVYIWLASPHIFVFLSIPFLQKFTLYS